jgi:hypothetical protein
MEFWVEEVMMRGYLKVEHWGMISRRKRLFFLCKNKINQKAASPCILISSQPS